MEFIQEFILQQKKEKTGSTSLTEGGPSKIIDLEEVEVLTLQTTSAGTSVPNTPPFVSPSREAMELIQTAENTSTDDLNIFSKFLEIKKKNETIKSNVYS